MVSERADETDLAYERAMDKAAQLGRSAHTASCTLLDGACCGWQWGELRKHWPELVRDVEDLYGKDWWDGVPVAQRLLLALFAEDALRGEAGRRDADELRLRIGRTLLAEIREARSRVLKQARAAG